MRAWVFLPIFLVAGAGCSYRIEKNPTSREDALAPAELVAQVSFQDVYTKVLVPRCIVCHGSAGNVNLETYASARSHLKAIKQVALTQRKMPRAPYPPLKREELLILSAWIQAGGPELPLNGQIPEPLPTPEPLQPTFESIKNHVLAPKCIVCHGPGGNAARMPLVTREDLVNSPLELVIPGNPEESGLVLSLLENARKRMPPPDSKITPVKPEEIAIIQKWIKNGAAD